MRKIIFPMKTAWNTTKTMLRGKCTACSCNSFIIERLIDKHSTQFKTLHKEQKNKCKYSLKELKTNIEVE